MTLQWRLFYVVIQWCTGGVFEDVAEREWVCSCEHVLSPHLSITLLLVLAKVLPLNRCPVKGFTRIQGEVCKCLSEQMYQYSNVCVVCICLLMSVCISFLKYVLLFYISHYTESVSVRQRI